MIRSSDVPATKSSASVRFGALPVSQVPLLTAWVPAGGRSMFDTTVIESRKDWIGFRIGLSSKPTPRVEGVQWLGRSPIGTKMAPKRRVGAPAVLTDAVSAGTIASSSGSASVAPIPRSIVRRDNAFFVTNISGSSAPSKGCPTVRLVGRPFRGAYGAFLRYTRRSRAHLERHAAHDSKNN